MNDYPILVVDDEEDLCEILKYNLEMEGDTHHLHHRQRHGERYADGIQSRCRRLYFETVLTERGQRTRTGSAAPYIDCADSCRRRAAIQGPDREPAPEEGDHRRRGNLPHEKGVRNPGPSVAASRTSLFERGHPDPGVERRSVCTGPYHRCKHYPPA